MAFTVDENKPYTAVLSIMNTSRKGGVPVAAVLIVGLHIYLETKPMDLIPKASASISFGPNETKNIPYPFVVPAGVSGASGTIQAWIEFPNGKQLAPLMEELIISGVHAMPPFVGEPALPPAGIGVPTAEEVTAVKATIRYRFEHLWFDTCAGLHYTTEMGQALSLSVAPMDPLITRYTAEIKRIGDQYMIDHKVEYDALAASYTELNRQIDVLVAGFNSAIQAISAAGYAYNSDGQVVDIYHTGLPVPRPQGLFVNWLSGEAQTLWIKWGCGFYEGDISYVNLDEARQAASGQIQMFYGRQYAAQLPTLRTRGLLSYRVWYCGFSLGY